MNNHSKIFEKGRSYIINSKQPDEVLDVFFSLLKKDAKGLIVTRIDPKDIKKKTEIIWLTNIHTASPHLRPQEIEQLNYDIEKFMTKNKGGIVFFSVVEYLISFSTFKEVFHLLQNLRDLASLNDVILITYLGIRTLDEKEENLIKQEFIDLGDNK